MCFYSFILVEIPDQTFKPVVITYILLCDPLKAIHSPLYQQYYEEHKCVFFFLWTLNCAYWPNTNKTNLPVNFSFHRVKKTWVFLPFSENERKHSANFFCTYTHLWGGLKTLTDFYRCVWRSVLFQSRLSRRTIGYERTSLFVSLFLVAES